jgi:hypothetical protein
VSLASESEFLPPASPLNVSDRQGQKFHPERTLHFHFSLVLIRAPCPSEKVYTHAHEMAQRAMKLINPHHTSDILDDAINATSGLRSCVEVENFISHYILFDFIHLLDSIITPEDACNSIKLQQPLLRISKALR